MDVQGLVRRVVVAVTAGTLATTGVAITTAPGSAAMPTVDILLLGDSYSAGNGAVVSGSRQEFGPADCVRSKLNWIERYAAGLREQGYTVNVDNHACSGGETRDFVLPRVMDTQNKTQFPLPSGVTTKDQATTWVRQQDPCNTRTFPNEEFWTYEVTGFTAGVAFAYDCTRKLRPQASFVTPETDLVFYTMGGNDVGFTSMVTECFVLKRATQCKAAIADARAEFPNVEGRLAAALDLMRAKGLRADARVVHLGYPYLQMDNDYTIPDTPAPYPAGDEIRALEDEGHVALAAAAATDNVTHPGQVIFRDGVRAAFAGHEPDAGLGNPARWVHQAFDPQASAINDWYHPNALGQQAYADLLLTGGLYGATPNVPGTTPTTTPTPTPTPTPAPPTTTPPRPRKVIFAVAPMSKRLPARRAFKLLAHVRLTDGVSPLGVVKVRVKGERKVIARKRVDGSTGELFKIKVKKGLRPGKLKLRVIYRDRTSKPIKRTVRVRMLPAGR